MTRRTLLASALLAGCSRQLARRYFGWLFVASAAERAVIVADLAEFREAASLHLPEAPSQILRSGQNVLVTCPEARRIFSIDSVQLRLAGRADLEGRIVAAAAAQESGVVVAATDQPALVLLDPGRMKITARIPLPAVPTGLDVTRDMAAVTLSQSLARVSLSRKTIVGVTPLAANCAEVRFRRDGQTILAGAPDSGVIVTVSAVTGALLTRLPLPLRPLRFCFNADGGQMFVTGSGGDTIAIVDPYQNQVDQTIVGGSAPCGMAVGSVRGQNLLFVTDAGSGDLTIFDVDTRRLASSIHVGGNPGEVLLTPDGEYALVVNRDTGDVAVIRLISVLDNTVIDKKIQIKPLFTVFSTGPAPQSALIFPRSRT